jgi:hypothetical protein
VKSHIFRVENWFRWVIDPHHMGYSDADILFVLDTVGVRERMKRILEGESQYVPENKHSRA